MDVALSVREHMQASFPQVIMTWPLRFYHCYAAATILIAHIVSIVAALLARFLARIACVSIRTIMILAFGIGLMQALIITHTLTEIRMIAATSR